MKYVCLVVVALAIAGAVGVHAQNNGTPLKDGDVFDGSGNCPHGYEPDPQRAMVCITIPPVDVPPREWDVDQKRTGYEWHGEGVGCSYDALPGSCKPKGPDFTSFEWIVRIHHRECVDKSRFLLMSEDGRWHCLALGRN